MLAAFRFAPNLKCTQYNRHCITSWQNFVLRVRLLNVVRHSRQDRQQQ